MRGSGERGWERSARCAAWVVAVVLTGVSATRVIGQEIFHRGENVVPVYEGWETNPDGSFNLVFGYLNRNYEEHLHIPVGPDNMFEPEDIDLGQPTHFFPRRHRFIFRVHVPADFGDREIVWTLRAHGRTEKAYGTLLPDYAIEDDMIAFDASVVSNMSRAPGNTPPSLQIVGEGQRTAAVNEPLSLSAIVTDDGLPPPPADDSLRNSRSGLSVTWFVYRGPADTVGFEPEQPVYPYFLPGSAPPPPPPPDGVYEVTARFRQPGEYVIRATALDGVLWTDEDVTVTVVP